MLTTCVPPPGQVQSRRCVSRLREFSELQAKHREAQRKRITREVKISWDDKKEGREYGALAEAEQEQRVEQYMSTGESPIHMAMAKGVLAGVVAKSNDIKRLEKDITEVVQMFEDLSILISTQGELVDSIETHVENA
eukprot:SAG22_NODE_3863_length_1493_cov_3.371593_2_plen_137_part_00